MSSEADNHHFSEAEYFFLRLDSLQPCYVRLQVAYISVWYIGV